MPTLLEDIAFKNIKINSVLNNDNVHTLQVALTDGLGQELTSKNGALTTQEYALEIARGNVAGAEPFGAYGKKVASGSSPTSLLWADGLTWYIPNQTVGEQISIVSTSANDTIGGTGINSIHIHYLDANLESKDEILNLNGTTPVLTTATNIRFIQCAHLNTIGSLKASAGIITFKNLAGTKIYNQIDMGEIRCSSSLRMVPKNKILIVSGIVGSSISGTASASSIISIAVSYFENHDYTNNEILMPVGTIGIQDSAATYILPIPIIVPEGTLVGMLCSTDKAAIIMGDWFGWLEDAN